MQILEISFFTVDGLTQIFVVSLITWFLVLIVTCMVRIIRKVKLKRLLRVLMDIPNSNYTDAIENITKSYYVEKEIIKALNKVSDLLNVSKLDYLKAQKYILAFVKYISISKKETKKIINENSNLNAKNRCVFTKINDQIYYVKNHKDLGEEQRIIFAKNEEGIIEVFTSDNIVNWNDKTYSNSTLQDSEINSKTESEKKIYITYAKGIEEDPIFKNYLKKEIRRNSVWVKVIRFITSDIKVIIGLSILIGLLFGKLNEDTKYYYYGKYKQEISRYHYYMDENKEYYDKKIEREFDFDTSIFMGFMTLGVLLILSSIADKKSDKEGIRKGD